jgi:uncharacterized protein DUF4430
VSRRGTAAALALTGVLAVAGCGFGPGEETGGATLTVTRDYGTERLLNAERSVSESETVLRLLDRNADLRTRYGGRFVQAIDGTGGTERAGRRYDWFFYVNGIESGRGAAEARARAGDRIWWDYRDWSSAMRVPAVVGSWPEPFVHGSDGKRFPVRMDCLTDDQVCSRVARRLQDQGVPASIGAARARVGENLLRVVVGPWAAAREDSAAGLLEEDPSASGVFATFVPKAGGGYRLLLLDARGSRVAALGPGAGLVAAVRLADQQPTWVVTGTDERGLTAAVGLLDQADLRDRYAVAISPTGGTLPVPSPARAEGTNH